MMRFSNVSMGGGADPWVRSPMDQFSQEFAANLTILLAVPESVVRIGLEYSIGGSDSFFVLN
jgi:hypothetical protein